KGERDPLLRQPFRELARAVDLELRHCGRLGRARLDSARRRHHAATMAASRSASSGPGLPARWPEAPSPPPMPGIDVMAGLLGPPTASAATWSTSAGSRSDPFALFDATIVPAAETTPPIDLPPKMT